MEQYHFCPKCRKPWRFIPERSTLKGDKPLDCFKFTPSSVTAVDLKARTCPACVAAVLRQFELQEGEEPHSFVLQYPKR